MCSGRLALLSRAHFIQTTSLDTIDEEKRSVVVRVGARIWVILAPGLAVESANQG